MPDLDFQLLTSHQLFKGISAEVVQEILAGCPVHHVEKGAVLIEPGQENHSLFVIASGRLEVRLQNPDGTIRFLLEAGEVIGEMSIIENRPTSAFVYADTSATLVEVPESRFWSNIVSNPAAMRNLLQMLTTRMRRSNQALMESMEQQLRFEQLQKELDTAGKIQSNILPKSSPLFPAHPLVDAHAVIAPAREVGGDLYDAFAIDSQRVCVAIGDVSGKGMPAALFMVRVITLLRISVLAAGGLEGVLAVVNRMLSEANDDMMFVTLFVAVLDLHTGQLEFSNGGHNPPLVSSQGQPFQPINMPSGMMLGVFDGAQYSVQRQVFLPGDRLLLYTDGVTEAENPRQEMYTLERTLDCLNTSEAPHMTALVNDLLTGVRLFSDGANPSDDITVLGVRLINQPA